MTIERNFGKCSFALTLLGFLLYLTDIGTDLGVAAVYLTDGHLFRFSLVLSVILVSAIILQSFSWSWYKDDENNSQGPHTRGRSSLFGALHIFQMGVLLRFIETLKYGYKAAFKKEESVMSAIYSATDLSMLRLFEAFLEAAPQAVLQGFILLIDNNGKYIQYVSVILSCMSISWATLDYYAALKKSLPDHPTLICVLPYLLYYLYKLLTLSARILLITLLATIDIIIMTVYLFVLWLIMIFYVFVQKTNFCTSKIQEVIYRAVVAVILVFTFFNIKDKNTRKIMSIYYVLRCIETVAVLAICWSKKCSTDVKSYHLPVSITIVSSLILGIICLVLYYSCSHPKRATDRDFNHTDNAAQSSLSCDEVDGPPTKNSTVILKNKNENSIMINSADTRSGDVNYRIKKFLSIN
ncbi:XK-related protein 9 [Hypanus sabinus]|uniref:XK-related protein 9 n=1 Tax=Hypanus sabinus TaxID=79690 RepID=UPI0028C380A1|nr:XK-related protein 9 [Hypanus sabinus]